MTLPQLPKRLYHHTSSQVQYLLLELKYRLQIVKMALRQFVYQYWFRLTIVGFFVGVLCLKDITIQFHWQNRTVDTISNDSQNTPPVQAGLLATKTTQKVEKAVSPKRKKQLKYVKRFAKVAQAEMEKFGIPASITLAQGLLETNAGDSPLAIKSNNHFGIKCFSKKCKKGHCANFSDDTHKDFFRTYATAWESFRAHSKLLQSKRYQFLYNLPTDDYAGWASGLKKAGYATDPRYPEKLVLLIESLNLQQYDS
ncbi:MAG: glycoside hydrolase family 73 protein [Saprospiraceae bacterium]